jgi:hypothetical protein
MSDLWLVAIGCGLGGGIVSSIIARWTVRRELRKHIIYLQGPPGPQGLAGRCECPCCTGVEKSDYCLRCGIPHAGECKRKKGT